jgi:hypothetical protein
MGVILKIQAGSLTGKMVEVKEGQTITVGRTDRSDVIIPQDNLLSSLHFAVELRGTTCRLVDRKSRNGTSVNGSRVSESVLHDGDEIRAGNTSFIVRVLQTKQAPPSPRDSPKNKTPAPIARGSGLAVGSWSFQFVPDDWEAVQGAGMRCSAKAAFPSNAIASQDQLQEDATLVQYVDSQKSLMRQFLPQVQFETAGPASVAGAEEATTLIIRYESDDGRPVVQRQVYARNGKSVGVLTFTTLETDLSQVQPVFDSILSRSAFQPQQ